MNDQRGILELEEGWEIIQNGITKQINSLEGVPDESPIDMGFKSMMHETIYTMCGMKPPGGNYSKEVYERYEGVYNNYLQSKVLPSIQEKPDDVSMLQELVKRWATYKAIVSKVWPYFFILDRFYIPRRKLPTVKDVGFGCFRKIVGEQMLKNRVKDVVITLINEERQGETIDQIMIKNVLQIYIDLGNQDDSAKVKSAIEIFLNLVNKDDNKKNMEYYVNGFEMAFLNDTADYYARKASNWTKEDYAEKVDECLQKEKDRATRYLHPGTEEKLLKTVQDVLLKTVQDLHPAQTIP